MELPDEILLDIFELLDNTKFILILVCKKWKDLSIYTIKNITIRHNTRVPLSLLTLRELNVYGNYKLHNLNTESLQILRLYNNFNMTDDILRKMTNLTELDLNTTLVSDGGISGLTNLTELYLHNSGVSNTGISRLTNLKTLYLYNTRVTDTYLSKLTGLESLWFNNTKN